VGEPADLFGDQVDGLDVAVASAVGVEVGQDLVFPGAKGAAEPGDSGIGQVWKHLNCDLAASCGNGV
jgi:hypothetical protein